MDKTNPEGLTFEEWVCAAGVAVKDCRCSDYAGLWPPIMPYTSSWTNYRATERLMLVDGNIVPRHGPQRMKMTFYSKKIRQAWRNGEDPSEWRM